MKNLVASILLMLAVPAFAEPKIAVLLPLEGAMSKKAVADAFRGFADARPVSPHASIDHATNTLYGSHVSVLVLDATEGPLPQNREYALATRQAGVQYIVVLITKVDELFAAVGDAEGANLLALEEQEIRNVLELYGIGGSDTLVFHDSAQTSRGTPTMSGDIRALASRVATLPSGARAHKKMKHSASGSGEMYLLTEPEANGRAITIEGSRNLQLWISGRSTPAAITVKGVARPGDVAEFSFQADAAVPAEAGAQMMLVDDGSIVGIGMVTAL